MRDAALLDDSLNLDDSDNATDNKLLTPRPRHGVTVLLVLFGVLLPIATLIFELHTNICAEELFDPVPTLLHIVLVAFVPFTLTLTAIDRTSPRSWGHRLPLLLGATLTIALPYTIAFIPITPVAFYAIIFFGFGLLPLAPLFSSLLTLLELNRRSQTPGFRRHLIVGIALGLAMAAVAETPRFLMRMAVSKDPGVEAFAIRSLRFLDTEDYVLRLARHNLSTEPLTPEQARRVYYRMTGKSYLWQETWRDSFQFDPYLGSDAVGAKLDDLFLTDSRLHLQLDEKAGLGYAEWTMVLENTGPQEREGRAEIQLPDGGVVSRVVLWINGEPNEAAFGSRSQVREAYQKVVRQRRDPLLVTTTTKDHVLAQCFPILPGDSMQILLGITFPLDLRTPAQGRFRMPRIVENNYQLADGFQHHFSTDSALALEDRRFLPNEAQQLAQLGWATVPRPATVPTLAAETDDGYVTGTFVEIAKRGIPPLVVVLDGSAAMSEHRDEIANAFTLLDSWKTNVTVLLAKDGIHEIRRPIQGWSLWVRELRFVGGQDAAAALTQAYDRAVSQDATILFLAGPQPIPLGGRAKLSTLDAANAPPLVALRLNGSQNLLEAFADWPNVAITSPGLSAERELQNVFFGGQRKLQIAPPVTESTATEEIAGMDSPFFRPLWAAARVEELIANNEEGRAVEVAVEHRIVTPVSGAVVLETAQQYTDAGLDPHKGQGIPAIPEPKRLAMLAAVLAILFLAWRRTLG